MDSPYPWVIQFQSTLSMRRATRLKGHTPLSTDISIHALHEESDGDAVVAEHAVRISIHALHEESDRAFP